MSKGLHIVRRAVSENKSRQDKKDPDEQWIYKNILFNPDLLQVCFQTVLQLKGLLE